MRRRQLIGSGDFPVLVAAKARELAHLADSIAARADAMAERIGAGPFGAGPSTREAQTERAAYRRQAGHAEGVRDVLRWLAGDAPSPMLADCLDLTEEHYQALADEATRLKEEDRS